MEVDVSQQIQD